MRLFQPFLIVLLLALPLAAPAGEFAFAFNPRTGDAVFDAHLGEINVLARHDLPGFVDDIAVSYAVPRVEVQRLVLEQRYAPADVYMIAHSARLSGLPFADVAKRYETDNGQGWGVMAKNLGIKPGSAEFHAMKANAGKSSKGWAKHSAPASGSVDVESKSAEKGSAKAKAKGKAKGMKK